MCHVLDDTFSVSNRFLFIYRIEDLVSVKLFTIFLLMPLGMAVTDI